MWRWTPARCRARSCSRQREALHALGSSGDRPPLALASTDPAGVRPGARRRPGEAAELTARGGLGDFGWLLQPVAAGPRALGPALETRPRGCLMPGPGRCPADARRDARTALPKRTGTHARSHPMTDHDGDDGRHRRRGGEHRHGAQHRPAAPLHARRAAAAPRPRRRAHPARRAGHRLYAPRRREALRGARLPPDRHARQPPRLAVGVLQRAGRRHGRRADARHGGPRARRVDPYAARRAEPGPQPSDVPRLVPARTGRYHPGLPRLPGARGAPDRDGGDLRRPDALHVQPGRRPQGGPAGGLAGPRPARRRRGPLPDGRLRQSGPRQRDLPGPHPRGRASSRRRRCTRTA